jgi:hypothetical protein
MNRDYTLNELGDKLVELGKKNHGHAAHAFAYGTITGMLNGPIMNGWSMEEIQKYINDKFEQVSKELATA